MLFPECIGVRQNHHKGPRARLYHQPHRLSGLIPSPQPRTGQDQIEQVPTPRLVASHSLTRPVSHERTGGQLYLVFRRCLSTITTPFHGGEATSPNTHWNHLDQGHRLTHSSLHPNSSLQCLPTIPHCPMDISNLVANPTLDLRPILFHRIDHRFHPTTTLPTQEAAFLMGWKGMKTTASRGNGEETFLKRRRIS